VDLVVDAADNFATSYLLSDACIAHKVPLVSASVNRSFGFVGIFCAGHGGSSNQKNVPSFRAVFPRLPKEQTSCDTVGVTGPSVGIIANIQAQEALKVLIADPQALYGKIVYADLWQYKLHCIDFSNALEPNKSRISIIGETHLTENDFILDVRNAEEIELKPQAMKSNAEIPLHELDQRLAEIPKTNRVVCVCASGQRALIAAQQIIDHGIVEVAALLPSA
jgi:rhodanese-related sulfurtransferase